MQVNSVSSAISLPDVEVAAFLPCSHMLPSFRACKKRDKLGCLFLFSYKDTSSFALSPTLMTSFNLNCLYKGPVSRYSHIKGRTSMFALDGGRGGECNVVCDKSMFYSFQCASLFTTLVKIFS